MAGHIFKHSPMRCAAVAQMLSHFHRSFPASGRLCRGRQIAPEIVRSLHHDRTRSFAHLDSHHFAHFTANYVHKLTLLDGTDLWHSALWSNSTVRYPGPRPEFNQCIVLSARSSSLYHRRDGSFHSEARTQSRVRGRSAMLPRPTATHDWSLDFPGSMIVTSVTVMTAIRCSGAQPWCHRWSDL